MAYVLRRVSDGKGDSGGSSLAIAWHNNGTFKEVVGISPTIDCSMQVGSMTARSYSNQDYWTTTPVTKILEKILNEETNYVRFKTENSEYEWWIGKYPKQFP